MPVTLTFRDKTYEVPAGLTVREAIRQTGLAPETTLAVREGSLVPDDEILNDGETIKLIAVVSGG
ncbi:MAG: MoaD/ThiS family protein [Chloroflexi bacterium]|nr:MoaD/ThiS family protein [Chloroflexota bacterium]